MRTGAALYAQGIVAYWLQGGNGRVEAVFGDAALVADCFLRAMDTKNF
jgi:hypothetical protein